MQSMACMAFAPKASLHVPPSRGPVYGVQRYLRTRSVLTRLHAPTQYVRKACVDRAKPRASVIRFAVH